MMTPTEEEEDGGMDEEGHARERGLGWMRGKVILIIIISRQETQRAASIRFWKHRGRRRRSNKEEEEEALAVRRRRAMYAHEKLYKEKNGSASTAVAADVAAVLVPYL